MDTEPNPDSTSLTNSPLEDMPTEEIFDCSYPDCDYKSLWKENVTCHEKGHDPTKQWDIPCQVCPQIFRSLVSFFYHMSSQHSSKLFCPWCLFLGEDLTDFRAHVVAHTQSVSSGPSKNKNVRRLKAQTPKSFPQKPSPKATEGTRKLSCDTCLKSFNHGSNLSRHKKLCNSKSFTRSAHNQAEIHDSSQDVFEETKFSNPTYDDDKSSITPSTNETQNEGTAELLMKTVNIEGETFYSCTICSHYTNRKDNLQTHFLVHTNHRPFRCPIKGCKYRAKSLQYLRKHSRLVHCINNLPAQENATALSENLSSDKDCDNQTEGNVNSGNSTLAFACMLCEFVGYSELAALEHARQHKPPSF